MVNALILLDSPVVVGRFAADVIGMRFGEVELGRVVMSLTTRPDFTNPLGTVHGLEADEFAQTWRNDLLKSDISSWREPQSPSVF